MNGKILKPALLAVCAFLLGYAAANYITPEDLRGFISPQNESAPAQTENASEPQTETPSVTQTETASPARERQLLTLTIERETKSASEIAAEETTKIQDASQSEPDPAVTQDGGDPVDFAPTSARSVSQNTAGLSSLPQQSDTVAAASDSQNGGDYVPSRHFAPAGAFENTVPSQRERASVTPLAPSSPPAPQTKDATISQTEGALPLLAIVIDDLGYSYEFAQKILDLDIPVTWTIIPEAGQSRRIAALAEAHGRPYLVHIPMQATIDKKGSSEYIIGIDTPEKKIASYLADLRDKFPTACGVSNHRGSRATSDIETMLRFMKTLAPTGWAFLDSHTSGKTVALQAAREYGIPVAQNSAFIDGKPDIAAMRQNLQRALHIAKTQGRAVAICHARETTLPFLKSLRQETYPVTFVTIDRLF